MPSATKHERKRVPLGADQIFLDRITKNHLIPTLRKFEQFPPLRTIEGPDRNRSLFIEQEEDPLISQDPEHDQNL